MRQPAMGVSYQFVSSRISSSQVLSGPSQAARWPQGFFGRNYGVSLNWKVRRLIGVSSVGLNKTDSLQGRYKQFRCSMSARGQKDVKVLLRMLL
jgi:hypothetical protein